MGKATGRPFQKVHRSDARALEAVILVNGGHCIYPLLRTVFGRGGV